MIFDSLFHQYDKMILHLIQTGNEAKKVYSIAFMPKKLASNFYRASSIFFDNSAKKMHLII